MTDQEVQSFGRALAERFKQIEEASVSAERRFREAFYSRDSTRLEVLELERVKDRALAIFETWKEVTSNLPFEISQIFTEHYKNIIAMEGKQNEIDRNCSQN